MIILVYTNYPSNWHFWRASSFSTLSFLEKGKAKIRLGGYVRPSIRHKRVGCLTDDGDGQVADRSHDRTNQAGVGTILAITYIAHIEQAIFHGPMMAQGVRHLVDGDLGRIPTAHPGGCFLTTPLGIVRSATRTTDFAHQAQVLPAPFLLQVGGQFISRHEPDFAPFDPAMPFVILDQIRGRQLSEGEKSAPRSRHPPPLSIRLDYPSGVPSNPRPAPRSCWPPPG